jgi:hypothetical protein
MAIDITAVRFTFSPPVEQGGAAYRPAIFGR